MSRDKNTNENNSKSIATAALVLLLLAALNGFAYIGWGPALLTKIQLYLLGKGAVLLPLGLLLLVSNLATNKKMLVFNKSTLGAVLLALTVLLMAHQLSVPEGQELAPENLPIGGGIIGGFLALGLHKMLGTTASWAAVAALAVLTMLLLLPLKEMHDLVKKLMFPGKPSVEEPEENRKQLTISGKNAAASEESSIWSQKLEEASHRAEPVETRKETVNVYQQEEFKSFTAGINKEGPIKKTINRLFKIEGDTDNIYEQEDIKAEIEKDPVQIPEWEEQKHSVVMRPVIDYEKSRINEEKQEDVKEDNVLKAPEEIINNSYRDILEQELKEKIKKTTIEMAEEDFQRGSNLWEVDTVEYQKRVQERETMAASEALEKELKQDNVYVPDFSETIASPKIEDNTAVNSQEVSSIQDLTQEEKPQQMVETEPEVEKEPEYSEVYVRTEHIEEEETVEKKNQVDYILPPIDLLNKPKQINPAIYEKDIMEQCQVLERTLTEFKVKAKVINVTRGPSVTRFEIQPAPGVKVNTIVNLAEDIALRMAASGVRMEAPIPGKAAIGIEVPNLKTDSVSFREIVESDVVQKEKSPLCIGLGKNISGEIITMGINKMPHLLVAGSTGSGKSVCINTIIAGVLFKARPDEVKLILVDPKVVELTNYNGIPHLLTPVVTDAKKAASALHWAVAEMERRYQLFADNNVRKIEDFNAHAKEPIPYIVIIIDELSDLMMVARVDVEDAILRLTQKARACGIHLIIATQRPSVDVITGIVKANVPSRIAFAVSSNTDSRTILDTSGAEKLLGKGDMLFNPIGQSKPNRVQGAFVSDEELHKIVQFIVNQSIPVNYTEEVTQQELQCDAKAQDKQSADDSETGNNSSQEDELFEDAVRLVLDLGQASASMLQRRFRIGFTRAGRLIDMMEELGIIGVSQGSKSREVIMSRQEVEERFLNHD